MTNRAHDSRQTKRILICDDEPRARQALRALLMTRGITCQDESASTIQVAGEARDGSEAIQVMKAMLPEVVVIDACMPGMDGLEATRLIKRKWPEVRVIVLTMHPDQRAAALAAGADAFLLKGCPAETLIETILS